jgi:hypothetical protein
METRLTQLNAVPKYFDALSAALDSSDSGLLQSVAFSCICHLIKRVILQNPEALKGPSATILPILINKFGDPKVSVRTTARRVFEDYWIACAVEASDAIRNVGFVHSDETVRLDCIQILAERIQLQEGKFAFRPFTSAVTSLLNDSHASVRMASQNLLISFFKSAHSKAKQDFYREMINQNISHNTQTRVLREIGFDGSADLEVSVSSSSSSALSHRSAPVLIKKPISSVVLSPISSVVLSVNFVIDQPTYAMDELPAEDISSPDDLNQIVQSMLTAFDGKETEFNWAQREKHVIRLRSIVRGNASQQYPDTLLWTFKQLSDGISKSISSLRTSLATNGCQLIKDAAISMGNYFDSTIEPYLSHLVRITSGAKKITGQLAAMTINAMIINTSYSHRYVNHIQLIMNDKVAQAKVYAATWIRLIMSCHAKHKSHIENSGGEGIIDRCISKALNDANPAVRESIRLAFWDFHEVWPRQAEVLLNKLDNTTRKALERVNPRSGGVSTSEDNSKFTKKQQPIKPTIREFIAKSREETCKKPPKEPVIILPPKPPSRLGRNARRVVVPLQPSSGVTSSWKSSSANDTKLVTPKPKVDTVDRPVLPPSVLQLLNSTDDDKFKFGVRALTYLLRDEDPPADIKCLRPPSLPTPDVIEKILHKVFDSQNTSYTYSDLVTLLCTTDIIGSVLQFVGTRELILGAVHCVDDQHQLRSSFDALGPALVGSEAFPVLAEVVCQFKDNVGVVEVCLSLLELLGCPEGDVEADNNLRGVLQSYDIESPLFEGAQTILSILDDRMSNGDMEVDANPNEPANNDPPEVAEAVQVDVEEDKVPPLDGEVPPLDGSVDIKHDEHEHDHLDANSQDAYEGRRTNARASREGTPGGLRGFPQASQMTQEPGKLGFVNDQQVDEVREGVSLSNELVEEASVDEETIEIQVPDPIKEAETVEIPAMISASIEIDEPRDSPNRKANIKPVEVQPCTPETVVLGMEISNKLSIFEDPEDEEEEGVPPILTPMKLKESVDVNNLSWLSFELRKEPVGSPLPQNKKDASRLYQSLIDQMDAKTIDTYGLRRLNRVIRGAKSGSDQPAYIAWTNGDWLSRLQSSLLDYMGRSDLSESEMSQILLLVAQLLEEPASFAGMELILLRRLVTTASRCTRMVEIGSLRETRGLLVKRCSGELGLKMLIIDSLVEICEEIDKSDTPVAREVPIFAVSMLAELVSNHNRRIVSPAEVNGLRNRLELLGNVIIRFIGDKETMIRREIYPLLVSLQQVFAEGIDRVMFDDKIASRMSQGQRSLMEHYYVRAL